MLQIDHLTVRYEDHTAVDDVTLRAEDGEVLCLLGPSGCGKSTLLRAVAGLVHPAGGTIHLDGRALDGLRPDQRRVGLMFQDHALFPHRTVADNVGFGPRMQGLARTDVAERVEEALTLVDLAGTDTRDVTSLSGGEQQRVALARAIAARPGLLMLDEPLGSLDRALRDRLLTDLPPLLRSLGTTVVYVTHDQDEALALADRIAVMQAGRIAQSAEPDTLWQAPRTEFVARFLGLDPILDATVRDGVATTAVGRLPLPEQPDGRARVALLLHALRLVDQQHPVRVDEVAIRGQVTARRFAGDHLRVRVRTDGDVDLAVPVWRGRGPATGDAVTVALATDAVHALADGHAPIGTPAHTPDAPAQ